MQTCREHRVHVALCGVREYIRVVSLEHQRDHELGFEVTDKVYFAETETLRHKCLTFF